MRPVALRNVVRYVKDLEANGRLYEALGFEPVRRMGDMLVLQHSDGLKLLLHQWEEARSPTITDTAIGLTVTDSVPAARRFLEEAGFRCVREPEEGDEGFFFIYGDLDGNPVNLVGMPPR